MDAKGMAMQNWAAGKSNVTRSNRCGLLAGHEDPNG
jgi:hypothetical protein